MKSAISARLVALGCAIGIAHVFFIQYCDFLFDCGCRPLWAGAAEHCNVLAAMPPHCPWCVEGGASGWIAFGLIVATQAGLALWPSRFGRGRLAALFLAFPVVGAVAGAVAGLSQGYWS